MRNIFIRLHVALQYIATDELMQICNLKNTINVLLGI